MRYFTNIYGHQSIGVCIDKCSWDGCSYHGELLYFVSILNNINSVKFSDQCDSYWIFKYWMSFKNHKFSGFRAPFFFVEGVINFTRSIVRLSYVPRGLQTQVISCKRFILGNELPKCSLDDIVKVLKQRPLESLLHRYYLQSVNLRDGRMRKDQLCLKINGTVVLLGTFVPPLCTS